MQHIVDNNSYSNSGQRRNSISNSSSNIHNNSNDGNTGGSSSNIIDSVLLQMEKLAKKMKLSNHLLLRVEELVKQLPCIPLDDIEWDDDINNNSNYNSSYSNANSNNNYAVNSFISSLSASCPPVIMSNIIPLSSSTSSVSPYSSSTSSRKEGSRGLVRIGTWYNKRSPANSHDGCGSNSPAANNNGNTCSNSSNTTKEGVGSRSPLRSSPLSSPSMNIRRKNNNNNITNNDATVSHHHGLSRDDSTLSLHASVDILGERTRKDRSGTVPYRVACKKLKVIKKREHFHKEVAAQMLLSCIIKPDTVVPKIYGYMDENTIVMELIDGQSLYDYLDTGNFMHVKQFSMLVDYLRHLSCWGLEHGDLHGGNIMVVSPEHEETHIVIIDYGRASLTHHNNHYDDATALHDLIKCGALGSSDRLPSELNRVKEILEKYCAEEEKKKEKGDSSIVEENYKKFEEIYWILNKEGTAPMVVYTPNGIRRSFVDVPILQIPSGKERRFVARGPDGTLKDTNYDGRSPKFKVFGDILL